MLRAQVQEARRELVELAASAAARAEVLPPESGPPEDLTCGLGTVPADAPVHEESQM